MAKRQQENLSTRVQKAKTFYDLFAIIADDHKQAIRRLERLLKGRCSRADRQRYGELVSGHESKLKALESRRQRYEKHHANKRIPAGLRKEIADLETDILRKERSYDWRDYVRYRKRDLAKLFEQVDKINNPPKPLATTNKAFKAKGSYSRQSITRAYDGHIWEVLKGHFEELPRAKGQRASFTIAAALPEMSEYLQLKERHFTKTLEILFEDAYGIVEELQGELQDAFENMPDSLQCSPVGEARQEAASELEEICGGQPEIPTFVAPLPIVHYPSLNQKSRSDEADEAAAMLRAVVQAVAAYRESNKLKKSDARELDDFVGQLEDHAENIESVEFPGMFG